MSNEIDTRVVEMQFDNRQFEEGVQTSVKSLDNLKEGLNLDAAARSLENIGQVANSFSLAGISEGVDLIAEKFTTLGIIGITMLQNITNSAMEAGKSLLKSFTIDPITSGMTKYEKKTIAVQTIMNATKKSIGEVEKELDKLTWYTDETSYDFAAMSSTVGKFVANGVELGTAVTAVEGLANWAALSGASIDTASSSMYQLAQAVGQGYIQIRDWQSIEGAQMATEEFKQTVIDTAKAMGMLSSVTGKTAKGIVVTTANFRTTLQDGWFSKDVLIKSLNEYSAYTEKIYQMTVDLGITTTEAMALLDKTGMAFSAKAFEAARVARTFTDVVRATIDAVSSGWMETFEILFGNFIEAKDLWTELALTLWDIFASGKEARNAILQDWKDLGGRTELIDALRLAYQKMLTVLAPIQEALSEMFPPITGTRLKEFTDSLMNLITNFKMEDKTATNLKSTFKGLFAILDIGKQAFTALAKGAGALITFLFPAVDGILGVTGAIGDMFVALDESIKSSNVFGAIIELLRTILNGASKGIKFAVDLICGAFNTLGNFDMSGLDEFAKTMQERFNPMQKLGELLNSIFTTIVKIVEWAIPRIMTLADNIGKALGSLSDKIITAFDTGGLNAVAQMFNSGVFFGILMGIKGFFDSLIGSVSTDGGTWKRINDVIDGVRFSLDYYQKQIKAEMILKIAVAIGILAVSLLVLSTIDPTKLTTALATTSALLMELMGALTIYQRVVQGVKFAGVTKATVAMLGIAVSMVILSSAVTKLAKIDVNGLSRSLGAIGILFAELSIFMEKTKVRDIKPGKGFGILILATALLVLATAVETLSKLNLLTLAQGLAAVGILLGELAIFMRKTDFSKIGVGQGVGLLIMATAISVLAAAVSKLSNLNLVGIAQGLVAVGILLGELALFMKKTDLSGLGIAKGIGLLIMASAVSVLALAVQKLSIIDLPALAQGLAAVGILLGELAIFMNMTTVGLKGAASLLIISGALVVMASALERLGNMSMSEILLSLIAMTGTFVVLGVAGFALAPMIPVLLGLGGAIALLGLGSLAAGAGILAFAAGLTALAAAGAGASAALVLIVTSLIGLIPMALRMMAEGVIAFAEVISRGAPAIVNAIISVAASLMDGIIAMTPKIMETLEVLLVALIVLCNKSIPTFVDAGMKLLIGFLKGLSDNMQALSVIAAQLIANLIEGIAAGLGGIIQAGVDLVIAFINGLAMGIRNNTQPVIDAGLNLLAAFIEAVIEFVLSPVKGVFTIGQAIVTGIQNGIKSMFPWLKETGTELGSTVIDATKERLDSDSPSKEFDKIGTYIGSGLANGIIKTTPMAVDAATNMATDVIDASADRLGAHSDADAFIEQGKEVVGGLASGIDDALPKAVNSSKNMATKVVDVAQEAFNKSKSWIDTEKYYNRMSLDQELAAWIDIQQQYIEGTEQRIAADREVYRVEQEIYKAGYTNSKNWLDDQVYYNKLSLNDQLAAWLRVQTRYLEGTDERKSADREVYRLEQALLAEGFNNSKNWIDQEKYYNRLSLGEELEAWKRVQARYTKGKEERIAADKEVYRVEQELIKAKDQLDSDHKARSMSINAQLKQDIKDTYAVYDDALASRTQSLYSTYGLFDKLEVPTPIDGVTLIANLQGQNEAFEAWQQNLNSLSAKGVDTKLISELQAMGPRAAAQIKALNGLTTPQLDMYVSLWQTKSAEAKAQATNELQGLLTEVNSIVVELRAQGVKDLAESDKIWSDQVALLGGTIVKQAKQITSEVTTITESIPDAVNALDWSGLGTSIVSGITKGVKDNGSTLLDEIVSLARAALQAAKDELGVASPSKAFAKVGMYAVMGLVDGLKNFANLSTTAASQVGTSAIEALQSTISNISDVVNGNIDMTPTIRPVLDLTNIKTGVNSINSLLAMNSNISAISATEKVASISRDMRSIKVSDPEPVFTPADLDALHAIATKANENKPDMTATIILDQPINIDGSVVAKNNSRHQAKFNVAKARALGVSV